jgi:hypothetical protein
MDQRIVLMIAGSAFGVLVALAVIYVITYRPTKTPGDYVSLAWQNDQIRGRRD